MPDGTYGVNIEGITVSIPPIDSSIAHAQEVQDVSLRLFFKKASNSS